MQAREPLLVTLSPDSFGGSSVREAGLASGADQRLMGGKA